MPGRKGYDMTWVFRGSRPQKSENIQQGSSKCNTARPDSHINYLESDLPSPLLTSPTQAPQEATEQPSRLSPGYSRSTGTQYTVYNQKTGRGWLRRSKSIDSSLPATDPTDQDASTDGFPSLTRMASGNGGHMSRGANYDRAGIRKGMGSIAQRAVDRATRASLTARRLLAPAGAHDAYRLGQLPGLIHPAAIIAPSVPTRIIESEMNIQSVPAIIVTSPSDDEDDNYGVRVINSRGRNRAQRPRSAYY
ncbi:hypothetical protein F4820DRAFT_466234 [Hypoxylon rubiginosum]|uniref:Uncharacterized protein n=1 Tax=Hypoxylon rubiginosum TaxID=110542 RepID=A0ACB9YKF3_9PEZI|nr:hypothetical protein F4820DRAFT_466234 [Hypoxylon rubiginosum]